MTTQTIIGLPTVGHDVVTGLDIHGFGNFIDKDGRITWYCAADISYTPGVSHIVLVQSGSRGNLQFHCDYDDLWSTGDYIRFGLFGTDDDTLLVYTTTESGMRLVSMQNGAMIARVSLDSCAVSLDGRQLAVIQRKAVMSVLKINQLAEAIDGYIAAQGAPEAATALARLIDPYDALVGKHDKRIRNVPVWCFVRLREILALIGTMHGGHGMNLATAVNANRSDLARMAMHLRTYVD